MNSFWVERKGEKYVVADGTLAVPREIPVGVVGHVDDRWNLVSRGFKHHIELVGRGNGVGDSDKQRARIALFLIC